MALTQTEIVGLTTKLTKALAENSAALQAKDYNPAKKITELDAQAADAAAADAKQERLKDDLKTQSELVTAKYDALYKNTSSTINAAAGLLDHTSEGGKTFLKLRSDAKRGSNDGGTAEPAAGTQK
jgi:hypothetical protein